MRKLDFEKKFWYNISRKRKESPVANAIRAIDIARPPPPLTKGDFLVGSPSSTEERRGKEINKQGEKR